MADSDDDFVKPGDTSKRYIELKAKKRIREERKKKKEGKEWIVQGGEEKEYDIDAKVDYVESPVKSPLKKVGKKKPYPFERYTGFKKSGKEKSPEKPHQSTSRSGQSPP